MYAYFLPASEHKQIDKRKLDRLRLRLRASRINGEFYWYNNQAELAQSVAKNTTIGTKNFITIGDDDNFHELLNVSVDLKNAAFGFIPNSKNSLIAHRLGIENPRQAYGVLAHRKIRTMPILQLNQALVFTETNFELPTNTELTITVDSSLEIIAEASKIEIINNLFEEHETKPIVLNLSHHLEAAGASHQKPIIRLNHTTHAAKAQPQIAHLQANRVEITSKSPLQNQLLTEPTTHLIIQQSDQPITVINRKHNELSSDG